MAIVRSQVPVSAVGKLSELSVPLKADVTIVGGTAAVDGGSYD